MNRPRGLSLLSLLVVASMVLAGCANATPTPETPPPTQVPPPTAVPPTAVPPTEVPFEAVEAVTSDCSNGTLFREIRALDRYTVQFTMCVPDPAFLSKIAFSPFAIYSQDWLEANTEPGSRLEKPDRHRPLHGERVESWREPDLRPQPTTTGATTRSSPTPWSSAGARRQRPGCSNCRPAPLTASTTPARMTSPSIESDSEPAAYAPPGAERLLHRHEQHLPAVRQREGAPGDRHGHRPPADRRHLLPGGLRSRLALHPVRHPQRLRG